MSNLDFGEQGRRLGIETWAADSAKRIRLTALSGGAIRAFCHNLFRTSAAPKRLTANGMPMCATIKSA